MTAEAKSNRKRRKPRKATAKSLENAAHFYLQRYSSSVENLRRVLMRRVERSVLAHDTSREEGRRHVDEIVDRFARSGLLDDRAYAESKAAYLFRRGGSRRVIARKLDEKGVPRDIVEAVLIQIGTDHEEAEFTAACALARRRRLGPYRAAADRPARREKDLAALARAGFDYPTARRVIDAETVEALEGMV